jgi:hypothetical protein
MNVVKACCNSVEIFSELTLHHLVSLLYYLCLHVRIIVNTIIITHYVSIFHSKNCLNLISNMGIYNFICGQRSYDAFPKWPARSFGLATPDLNGSDDGVQHSELCTGFVDFVYRPKFQITRKQHFRKWICFRLNVRGKRHILCWIPWKELT